MRLCKDCRHYIYNELDQWAACGAPNQPVFDPVYGKRPTCAAARLDPGKLPLPNLNNCGPAGIWFEPKDE